MCCVRIFREVPHEKKLLVLTKLWFIDIKRKNNQQFNGLQNRIMDGMCVYRYSDRRFSYIPHSNRAHKSGLKELVGRIRLSSETRWCRHNASKTKSTRRHT